MVEQLKIWREDRTLAHVVPFGVFMVFTLLYQFGGGAMEWKHDDAVWFRRWPEQLFYPLQTIATFGTLLFFWKHYELKWSNKIWIGAVAGLIGIGFWLLPTTLYDHWGMTGKPETFLEKLSGLAPRKEGFDPGVFEAPAAYWVSLILRVLRAVVIVALVEEIFWRGFLMRFLLRMVTTEFKRAIFQSALLILSARAPCPFALNLMVALKMQPFQMAVIFAR